MASGRQRGLVPPTRWTRAEFEADRQQSISAFREERIQEPLELYDELFVQRQGVMEDLLEGTIDLAVLEEHALALLSDKESRDAVRYLAGPPISEDDWKTIVDTHSLSPRHLQANPDLVRRLVMTIRDSLDRRRFPRVFAGRDPSEAERNAAILASAALSAMRGVETKRRFQGKTAQEAAVQQALLGSGFSKVRPPNRNVSSLADAPDAGEFTGEAYLGDRLADFIVGLWDSRTMTIECKASNSSLNSIKRLNNDTAAKASSWIVDYGQRHIVPVAVLSGVYDASSLERAQDTGLTIYWGHRLSDLTDWIERTRP